MDPIDEDLRRLREQREQFRLDFPPPSQTHAILHLAETVQIVGELICAAIVSTRREQR